MKLTPIQCGILAHLKLDAQRELKDLARTLQVSEKTIRYNFDLLQRRQIISRVHCIDLYPLGFRYDTLYFSVASAERGAVAKLLAKLAQSRRLSWLGELGGDYHYGAAFAVRNFEDIREELYQIPELLQNVIYSKALNIHLSLTMFPLKFLAIKHALNESHIGYGTTGQPRKIVDLDELGWRLLSLLSRYPELSLRELARQLGRAVSSISERMQQLRDLQILKGSWLRINFETLGFSTYKLIIYTKNLKKEFAEALRLFCRNHRNVDSLIECVGEWEFEIGVVALHAEDVMQVTRDLYEKFSDQVKLIKTLPLLRVLQWNQVPVHDDFFATFPAAGNA